MTSEYTDFNKIPISCHREMTANKNADNSTDDNNAFVPLPLRQDLLVSASVDSEASLQSEGSSASTAIFSSDGRAYNISLTRKLRRMKRRLLLEKALIIAQGPTNVATTSVPPTNSNTTTAKSA